ncbi:hypothetical protein COTS27_00688 [Spirochaetota bacterium]|nr:hypothetical protein COTS27_00688 [Spirochaetota bacterium]
MLRLVLRFFIDQHKAVNLGFILVIIAGILTFIYGRKEGFPNVPLNIITITTHYLGASADLVEELVTNKIEDNIDSINGHKRITSYSSEGRSVVTFEVADHTTRTDTEISNDIETAISPLEFPANVLPPIIKVLNFENTEINIVAGFISKSKAIEDIEAIKSIANRFRNDVRKIPGIGLIEFEDYPKLEIWIEIKPEQLRLYELELNNVVNVIRTHNLDVSAGKINLGGKEFFIKTTKQYSSLTDIENTIIRGNDTGQDILLKDIASVRWSEEALTSYKRYKEMSGVWLNIYKANKGDAITVSKNVKKLLASYQNYGLIPAGVQVITIDDLADSIRNNLVLLASNAVIGLVLIFSSMILFFNFRVAFLTVLGIPFSFCLGVIIMYALGLTINVVSIFGMIIVVGMIVDDAVIIAENVYTHTEKGLPSYEAALTGTTQMLIPIIAITATTILAFLPLMTLPGIVGDVIVTLPQTVIIVLFCSLIECLIVLPGHLAHSKFDTARAYLHEYATANLSLYKILQQWIINIKIHLHNLYMKWHKIWTSKIIKKPLPYQSKPLHWYAYITDLYTRLLTQIFKKPIIAACGLIFILTAASMLMIRNIPFVFFPGDAKYIIANIETDKYNRLVATEKIIDMAEKEIRSSTPARYVTDITSTVGSDGTVNNYEYKLYQPYIGSVRITLDTTIRKNDKTIVRNVKKAIDSIPGITQSTVSIVKGGPPVGKPIDIYVKGSRNADVITAAAEVHAFVKTLPNLIFIDSSYETGKEIVNIKPNENLASILDVNLNHIAATVSNAFAKNASTTITSLKEFSNNERNIDLIVKYAEDNEKIIEDLYNTPILNQRGNHIPLKNFSKIDFEKSSSLLIKEDGDFYISISAFLIDETSLDHNAATLAERIREKFPAWQQQFPTVSFVFKGQQEAEAEQSVSLIRAVLIALFSIYFVLTIVFKSYLQPLIVMSIIPLGFVGIVFGLFVTHTPIGLMPFLGGIALIGIIVNDSLIMVDKINRLRQQHKMNLIAATIEGARSRMRPILITSFTTIVGIMPLAYGFAGYDPYLGDMAISLMWGLILSTTLLLVLLPLFYVIIDNFIKLLYGFFNKEYPPTNPYK